MMPATKPQAVQIFGGKKTKSLRFPGPSRGAAALHIGSRAWLRDIFVHLGPLALVIQFIQIQSFVVPIYGEISRCWPDSCALCAPPRLWCFLGNISW